MSTVHRDVVGLDLSLTSSGVATRDRAFTLPTTLRGVERLAHLRSTILSLVGPLDLVVIEGYSYGSRSSQAHALGELGGVIRLALHEGGIRYVIVPPKSVKKYATGKGNAGKEEMLTEAVRRLGYAGHSNDEADALWLRAMALDALGAPFVKMPEAHRIALTAIEWPGAVVA